MSKLNWLNERRKGIGGSDAPVVAGVSKWKTPYQLYLEKRGEVPDTEDNEAIYWGRALEPVIRQRYADETGRQVIVPNKILQHPTYPFMLANVDGLAEDRVLEIKTARSLDGWGEPGSAEIPEAYMLQIQHYMVVTAYPMADVAALIGGNDFRIYEVPADKELQELLIEREAEFWGMVQAGTPPETTTYADVRLKYRTSRAVKVQADEAVIQAIQRLKQIREIAKQEDEIKAQIMAYLKEADTLVEGDKVLATWKAGKGGKRFNTKAFQAAQPELYAQFLEEAESYRRLLIK